MKNKNYFFISLRLRLRVCCRERTEERRSLIADIWLLRIFRLTKLHMANIFVNAVTYVIIVGVCVGVEVGKEKQWFMCEMRLEGDAMLPCNPCKQSVSSLSFFFASPEDVYFDSTRILVQFWYSYRVKHLIAFILCKMIVIATRLLQIQHFAKWQRNICKLSSFPELSDRHTLVISIASSLLIPHLMISCNAMDVCGHPSHLNPFMALILKSQRFACWWTSIIAKTLAVGRTQRPRLALC